MMKSNKGRRPATYGDPGRLINPTDSIGQVCGRDLAVRNKPFLFFFDLTRCASPKVPFTGCPTPQICVESCPTENWFYLPGSSNDKSKLYCKEGVNKSKPISDLILTQDCAAYYVHSQNITNRCVPRSLYNYTHKLLDSIVWQSQNLSNEEKFDFVTDGLKYVARFVRFQEVAEGVVEDIRSLWPYILGGCVIAMILSFLWIFLLRLIAKVMVWLSLILFTCLSGFVSYYTLNKYLKAKNHIEEDKMMTQSEKEFVKTFSSVSNVETTWLVFFIITVSLFIICLFILIFLRKRIKLAIALINEASKALGHMMSAIYNVFAVIWTMLFVSAFCEYVLAGAFASYYWSFNKPADIPATPVIKSLGRTCRYHLGTIAFGSLIIAIVRFIRLIFEYIDHKIKKYADNFIVKMISCCFRCCLWCLEKFLKFINRNAYIYSAIYGTNFCTSARKAFSLLMRNIIRVVVLDKVTDFLLLIGKLVVTGTMALLSFGFFSGEIIDLRDSLPPMNYYLTPVIIITIATFFIASAFFDVYNMAVDTLFYCFLEDSERNDGSAQRPYYMSKELKKILHKKNKDE
ncbi:Choline transporter-like protein 2 [Armadillidium vulgare]|nr:Choline transporter-like protein 2 [Armadillidium vulgare]